jgi:hypothetical protein
VFLLKVYIIKNDTMMNEAISHFDKELIHHLGLQPAAIPEGSQLTPNARVYAFPSLENVFVMESDFYGNPMPDGSYFLAFQGKRGLLGRHISVDELRNCSPDEIQKIVESLSEG